MTCIAGFTDCVGDVVEGQYYLTEISSCRGTTRRRWVLEDFSGKASLVLTAANEASVRSLPERTPIKAAVVPKPLRQVMGGTLLAAKTLQPMELWNAAAVIPMSFVPLKAQAALSELTVLIDELTVLPIKRCINQIVSRNWRGLVQSQAGWKYHHAFVGGLLVHTVSVMKRVKSVGGTTFVGDHPRIELMMLAALIHDLGKSIQIDKTVNNPAIKHLRHELLNLTLCINEITQLGREWPEGSRHLSRSLNWLCSGTEERKRNHSIDAELVHMMDVVDVWHDRALPGRDWGI